MYDAAENPTLHTEFSRWKPLKNQLSDLLKCWTIKAGERFFTSYSGVVSTTARGALKFRQYRHSFEVLIITAMSSEPGIDRCWLSWCWIWLRVVCSMLWLFIVMTHRCIGFRISWLYYWTCASIPTAIAPKPLGFIWLVCLLFLLTKLSLDNKNDC